MSNLTMMVLLAAILAGCEGNPVGDNRISIQDRQLSGRIEFDSSQIPPEKVYVWLESFDIHTETDRDGRFTLTLPPPGAQNQSGITSAFSLYYFMGNYDLRSSEVVTRNGEFVHDTRDISADGEIRQAILMSQRFRIKTRVQPTSVSKLEINVAGGKSDFFMEVNVALQAVRDDTVILYFPRERDNFTGPLLFRNKATNEVTVLNSTIGEVVTSDLDTVTTEESMRPMTVNLFPDDLAVGEYEIIPFLLVNDIILPNGLRDEFGLDILFPGSIYLKIPFVRESSDATFIVND